MTITITIIISSSSSSTCSSGSGSGSGGSSSSSSSSIIMLMLFHGYILWTVCIISITTLGAPTKKRRRIVPSRNGAPRSHTSKLVKP